MSRKPAVARPFPVMDIPRPRGGPITPDRARMPGRRRNIVRRGLHRPTCRQSGNAPEPKLRAVVEMGREVGALCGDPEAKPRAFGEEAGRMQTFGPFISRLRWLHETGRPCPETGRFPVNSEGGLHFLDMSRAPFPRPDIGPLPRRVRHAAERGDPVRPTHTG